MPVCAALASRTTVRRSILSKDARPVSPTNLAPKISATERKSLEGRALQLQEASANSDGENVLSSMENVADQFSTITMRKTEIKNSDYRRAETVEEVEEEENPTISTDEEAEETMYSSADDEDSLTEF